MEKVSKHIFALLLALVTILSLGSAVAMAGKKPIVGLVSPTSASTGAMDDSIMFRYDFAYKNNSKPTYVGVTMPAYSYDGVYLGDTSPLQKTSYKHQQHSMYSFTFNNKQYYLEEETLMVIVSDDLNTYLAS